MISQQSTAKEQLSECESDNDQKMLRNSLPEKIQAKMELSDDAVVILSLKEHQQLLEYKKQLIQLKTVFKTLNVISDDATLSLK